MHIPLIEGILLTYYSLRHLNTIAKMSGALKKFGDKVISDPKQVAKLFNEATPGSRLLPSRTPKK